MRCDKSVKTLADPSAGRRDVRSEAASQKKPPFQVPSEFVVCAQYQMRLGSDGTSKLRK